MKKNSDILYIIFADLISPYIVETLNVNKSDMLTKFWDSFCSKIVPKNSQKLFQTLFDPKTLLKNKDIQPEDIEMLLYSMRFCVKTIISFDNESIYKKILTENNLEFLASNYIILLVLI